MYIVDDIDVVRANNDSIFAKTGWGGGGGGGGACARNVMTRNFMLTKLK